MKKQNEDEKLQGAEGARFNGKQGFKKNTTTRQQPNTKSGITVLGAGDPKRQNAQEIIPKNSKGELK